MDIRLNKYLASAGVAARRKADILIEQGKVKLNGQIAKLGTKVNPDKDVIEVGGKKITGKTALPQRIYIILNKPKGVVSTVVDTHGRTTVIDLVKMRERLYPVGRLDAESEGLMILTNDGDLAYRLTHPSHHVPKVYIVDFLGVISPDKIGRFKSGVKLDDGMTAPAQVKVIFIQPKKTRLQITLFEGRNRQIRKMAEKLRLHVLSLKRVKMGSLELGDLKSGQSKALTKAEIAQLTKF